MRPNTENLKRLGFALVALAMWAGAAESPAVAQARAKSDVRQVLQMESKEEVAALLDRGLPVNELIGGECPPLYYVAGDSNDYPRAKLRLLLSRGANANLRCADGDTVLWALLFGGGNAEDVRLLLAAGADPKGINPVYKMSLLAGAIRAKHRSWWVKPLLEAGANPEDLIEGRPAVEVAFDQGDEDTVAELCRAGAKPRLRLETRKWFTDLMKAAPPAVLQSTPEAAEETGMRLYSQQNYAAALPWLASAANRGARKPLSAVARIHRYGLGGVPIDGDTALTLYRWSAATGESGSLSSIGLFYLDGIPPVERNDARAIGYFRKAAELGHTGGMYNLAVQYVDGRGTERDIAKHLEWLHKAAERNHPSAINRLGHYYEYGDYGFPQDLKQALAHYQKAAQAGNAYAMLSLGQWYASGNAVVAKNPTTAGSYYEQAGAVAVPHIVLSRKEYAVLADAIRRGDPKPLDEYLSRSGDLNLPSWDGTREVRLSDVALTSGANMRGSLARAGMSFDRYCPQDGRLDAIYGAAFTAVTRCPEMVVILGLDRATLSDHRASGDYARLLSMFHYAESVSQTYGDASNVMDQIKRCHWVGTMNGGVRSDVWEECVGTYSPDEARRRRDEYYQKATELGEVFCRRALAFVQEPVADRARRKAAVASIVQQQELDLEDFPSGPALARLLQ